MRDCVYKLFRKVNICNYKCCSICISIFFNFYFYNGSNVFFSYMFGLSKFLYLKIE